MPALGVHDLAQPQHRERPAGLDGDPHELLDVRRCRARRTPAARRSAAWARSRARRPGAPPPATPGAAGVLGVRAARLDHRDDVLRHELRHPVEPHRVDVGRRGRLHRAGGEQAGPGEHRGQRLRHGAEAGVDDQRQVDRPARAADRASSATSAGQPRHRAHELADQPAVAAVAGGEVARHDHVHIRAPTPSVAAGSCRRRAGRTAGGSAHGSASLAVVTDLTLTGRLPAGPAGHPRVPEG